MCWCPTSLSDTSPLSGCGSLEELLTEMGWNQIPPSAQIPSFKQATDITVWYWYDTEWPSVPTACAALHGKTSPWTRASLLYVCLYTSLWEWAVRGRKELKKQMQPWRPICHLISCDTHHTMAGVGRAGSCFLSLPLAEPLIIISVQPRRWQAIVCRLGELLKGGFSLS